MLAGMLVGACDRSGHEHRKSFYTPVRVLADHARMYHREHGAFPPTAPLTPPLGECCGKDEGCTVGAATWQHPTWQALAFHPEGRFHLSAAFETDGISSFTARGHGDIECDGVYSTFEVVGTLGDDGAVSTWSVPPVNERE